MKKKVNKNVKKFVPETEVVTDDGVVEDVIEVLDLVAILLFTP